MRCVFAPHRNRTDVGNCTDCVDVGGCGYCLSTLQCVDGTSIGPSDGSPCPSWIFEADVCPGKSMSCTPGFECDFKATIRRDNIGQPVPLDGLLLYLLG